MDFTEMITMLKNATLYDLYRIRVAIQNEMENPERIRALRACFAVGDSVSYFNAKTNALSQAVVLQKKPKYILVKDLGDNKNWNVPYYMINLTGKASDIRSRKREKLTKNHLKVGDLVGFDYDGKQYIGVINKLNYKTVNLTTRENKLYRVSYGMLFKVLEGEQENEIYTYSIEERGILIRYTKDGMA